MRIENIGRIVIFGLLYFSTTFSISFGAEAKLDTSIEIKPATKVKQVIELVTGLPKPPFIMDKDGNGLQLELIKAALAFSNIEVKFVAMPLGRNITGFLRRNADGVITLIPEYKHPSLHLSIPYVTYQNVAISLVEKQFSIVNISDLSNKNIMAFQNAKKFLGEEYNEAITYTMGYREVHDQELQIENLFLRRAEVIILELNIFKWFIKNAHEALYSKPFSVHYIFDEKNYSVGFKSKDIRDKFNQGIQKMREDGSYQMIIDSYFH